MSSGRLCKKRTARAEVSSAYRTEQEKQRPCIPDELMGGECWIRMTQAISSGLILATRVGKHTDEFISQLVVNTEDKTDCQQWHRRARVFGSNVKHLTNIKVSARYCSFIKLLH